MQNGKNGSKSWEKNAISTKLVLIGVLALLLLIPAAMVGRLIDEREGRKAAVTQEIGSKWGEEQTLTGPVLRIPYQERQLNANGQEVINQKALYLLPEALGITAAVDPETRYRGIYQAVVYSAKIRLQGNFNLDLLRQSGVPAEDLLLEEATIFLGMSDLKGVRDQIRATLNGAAVEMNPGLPGSLVPGSIGAPLAGLRNLQELRFDFGVDLNGNRQLRFIPVGKVTEVAVSSPWSSPSFSGAFLPVDRAVSDSGFSAAWKVLHFNRDLPQVWNGGALDLDDYAFGVDFIIPADIYQQAARTAKYAILFIGFTFSAFFLAEILNRRKVHPVQYLLIGLALILFYVLLISISEHLTFAVAYLLATVVTIALIALYAVSVLHSRRLGGIVAAILAGLYGYMFVLLNLEDYALLMGGLGLVAVLALVMYLTRQIDWYADATELN